MTQADSNGRVAQALVTALREEMQTTRVELMAIVQPLVKQVAAHEEMSKSHCHELYNTNGSRIQALESDVKTLKDESGTKKDRRWDLQTIFLAAAVGFCSAVIAPLLSNVFKHLFK